MKVHADTTVDKGENDQKSISKFKILPKQSATIGVFDAIDLICSDLLKGVFYN